MFPSTSEAHTSCTIWRFRLQPFAAILLVLPYYVPSQLYGSIQTAACHVSTASSVRTTWRLYRPCEKVLSYAYDTLYIRFDFRRPRVPCRTQYEGTSTGSRDLGLPVPYWPSEKKFIRPNIMHIFTSPRNKCNETTRHTTALMNPGSSRWQTASRCGIERVQHASLALKIMKAERQQ